MTGRFGIKRNGYDDPKNKYCIWCGQALDWREK